ncbi:MAG: dienelactone hydrolase family protein [Pirellulaceae bacterium]|nr:dienelactone hydrolase family protein [Pirellulaceae bacterium]
MKYLLGLLVGCLFAAGWSAQAMAEVQTKLVEYSDGEVKLEGFVAWDPARTTSGAPGILVVHQWLGLTEYEQTRCRQLAELGYVAFALDIYGKGVRPANTQEAGKQAGVYKKDRQLYRRRLNLGLDQLKAQPGVAPGKLAAIGYCFGGTGALELARSGADVAGFVSFHGGLDAPTPADAQNIKGKVLICHGNDDPFVPVAEIDAMKASFNQAKVDWQMIYYSGAVHSFTQKMAGNDNSVGAAYNAKADMRSWSAMRAFFDELFAQK